METNDLFARIKFFHLGLGVPIMLLEGGTRLVRHLIYADPAALRIIQGPDGQGRWPTYLEEVFMSTVSVSDGLMAKLSRLSEGAATLFLIILGGCLLSGCCVVDRAFLTRPRRVTWLGCALLATYLPLSCWVWDTIRHGPRSHQEAAHTENAP